MPLQMKDVPSSLCDTCRHAIITRALGQNEREIRCRMLSERRVAPMAECSVASLQSENDCHASDGASRLASQMVTSWSGLVSRR